MPMNSMETLDLVVAEPWYSLMAAGIKTEEFRRDCKHWRKRLMVSEYFRKYDFIRLRNGYGADRPKSFFVFKGIRWQETGIIRRYVISDTKPSVELEMPGALFIVSLGEKVEPWLGIDFIV